MDRYKKWRRQQHLTSGAPSIIEPSYYAPLRAGDYKMGLLQLQHYLRLGDARAMCCYASLLLTGRGVSANPVESMNWYRQAAILGNASGMAGLGLLYLKGHGVAQDLNEAAVWLFKATEAGHRRSATILLELLAKHPEMMGLHFSEEAFAEAYVGAVAAEDIGEERSPGSTVH